MSAITLGARTTPELKPEEKKQREMKQVAEGLEAHFTRQILAEFHMDKGAWTGGGMAGETFAGMLQESLADTIAKAGGLGLGKTIAKALEASATGSGEGSEKKKIPAEASSDRAAKALESMGMPGKAPVPLKPPLQRSIQRYGGGYED